MKHCKQCRDGEHDNIDDDLRKVTYKDPSGGRVKTEIMCESHRICTLDDFYVIISEKPI